MADEAAQHDEAVQHGAAVQCGLAQECQAAVSKTAASRPSGWWADQGANFRGLVAEEVPQYGAAAQHGAAAQCGLAQTDCQVPVSRTSPSSPLDWWGGQRANLRGPVPDEAHQYGSAQAECLVLEQLCVKQLVSGHLASEPLDGYLKDPGGQDSGWA